jgi:hypothetical protein
MSPYWASVRAVPTLPEIEEMLRERLEAFPRPVRVEMLRVLRLPDFERAAEVGRWWSLPRYRPFAELLIDAEEDRPTRAVLVGLLAESMRPASRRSDLPGLARSA